MGKRQQADEQPFDGWLEEQVKPRRGPQASDQWPEVIKSEIARTVAFNDARPPGGRKARATALLKRIEEKYGARITTSELDTYVKSHLGRQSWLQP